MTASEIVLIISAVASCAVAVITAWRTGTKVDAVHTLTNRNFSEQKAEISELRAELQAAASELATKEQARAVLAAETAASFTLLPPQAVSKANEEQVKVKKPLAAKKQVKKPLAAKKG